MLASHPESFALAEEMSATDQLNGVALSAAHLEGAMRTVAQLPAHARDNPMAQALALQAYAEHGGLGDDALASAALHARISALAKWTAAHDPERQSNAEAVMEAAARFALTEEADGIGFEPGGFQELVLFIEELPW